VAKDDRPLITNEESSNLGWGDEMIDAYPSADEVLKVLSGDHPRVQLARWYRYLNDPQTDAEREIVRIIIEYLRATYPQ
jgi:hypothetical protein